jgi:FkbM family methyltransferase
MENTGSLVTPPSTLVEVAGRTFCVPTVDGWHWHLSEPWMVDLQKGLMTARNGTFVDVGMNLGQTLLAVKAIDPARHYIGFEPNPHCFAYCEQLTQLNQLPNVSLVPIGLSSNTGIARLHLYSNSRTDSCASLVDNFRPDQPVVSVKFVPVFSFSDLSKTFVMGEIGILKIDVEGGEWDVLQPMEATLKSSHPWIVIEILPCYDSKNTERIARQELIAAMLRRLDYRIFRIRKGSTGRLQGLEPLDDIGIHSSIALSDYVLCPRHDFDKVAAAVSTSIVPS